LAREHDVFFVFQLNYMTETSNVQELQIKVWDHDLLIKADPEVFSSCINCIFGKKQALFNGCKLMQY